MGSCYNKYNRGQVYGAPSLTSTGYLRLRNRVTGKSEFMHRIIWQELNGDIPEGMVIDHINHNTTDNRIENLQCITSAKNSQRMKVGSVSKITRNLARPYRASRWFNCKNNYLGYFGTIGGAIMATNMMFIEGET